MRKSKKNTKVRVRDLKPKKDAKGGGKGPGTTGTGPTTTGTGPIGQ
jgi:hypothetical protein